MNDKMNKKYTSVYYSHNNLFNFYDLFDNWKQSIK